MTFGEGLIPSRAPHPLSIYSSIVLGCIAMLIATLVFITCGTIMPFDFETFEGWLCMSLLCVLAATIAVAGCLLTVKGLKSCAQHERNVLV